MDLVHDVDELTDDRRRQAERQLVDQQQLRVGDERLADRRASAAHHPRGCRPSCRAGRSTAGTARAPAPRRRPRRPCRCASASTRAAGSRARSASGTRCDRRASSRCRARRPRSSGSPVTSSPMKNDLPRLRQQAGDALEQRRLAGAVRAEQRDDLALVDLEVEPEQDLHRPVGHVDAATLQQRPAAGRLHLTLEPRWSRHYFPAPHGCAGQRACNRSTSSDGLSSPSSTLVGDEARHEDAVALATRRQCTLATQSPRGIEMRACGRKGCRKKAAHGTSPTRRDRVSTVKPSPVRAQPLKLPRRAWRFLPRAQ